MFLDVGSTVVSVMRLAGLKLLAIHTPLQACQLLSPMAVGFLMARTSLLSGTCTRTDSCCSMWSASFAPPLLLFCRFSPTLTEHFPASPILLSTGALLAWTLASLPLEMLLLAGVHRRSSALQEPPLLLLGAHDEEECCALKLGAAEADAEKGDDQETLLGGDGEGEGKDELARRSAGGARSEARAAALSLSTLRLRRWTRPLSIFYRQRVRSSPFASALPFATCPLLLLGGKHDIANCASLAESRRSSGP